MARKRITAEQVADAEAYHLKLKKGKDHEARRESANALNELREAFAAQEASSASADGDVSVTPPTIEGSGAAFNE